MAVVPSLAGAGQDFITADVYNYKPYFDEVFDYIIEQDGNGDLVPGLAESWSASDDHLTWTFVIREGVKFHNGDTLTAEDVAWTWNRGMLDPQSKQSLVGLAEVIDGKFEFEGNNVVVKTKEPFSSLPIWLAKNDGAMTGIVYPKKYFEEVGTEAFHKAPVGTGPFKVVELHGEESVDLTAFVDEGRNDWQKSRTPHFKDLKIMAVPDASTRMALLKTGEADLVPLPISSGAELTEAGLGVINVPSAASNVMWCLGFTLNPESPCDDRNVREALSIAIDRQAIADSVLRGFAKPSGAWPDMPGSFGYPEGLSAPAYDPERAKQLLADAGYGPDNPLKVEIATYDDDADSPLMPTQAEAIAGYLGNVGVQATIRLSDWQAQKAALQDGTYTGQANNPAVDPVTLWMRGIDNRYIFVQDLTALFSEDLPQGAATFDNDRLPDQKRYIEAIGQEFDLEKQQELFQEYNEWSASNFSYIPLIAADAIFGTSPKIASWDVAVPGKSYPHNLWSLVPAN